MHYIMGGLSVEPETGDATLPGLFAAGEASGGMHGANVSAATRSPTSSCSGAGPVSAPPNTPRSWANAAVKESEVEAEAQTARALRPLTARTRTPCIATCRR